MNLLVRALNLVERRYRCFDIPIGKKVKNLQRDRTKDLPAPPMPILKPAPTWAP